MIQKCKLDPAIVLFWLWTNAKSILHMHKVVPVPASPEEHSHACAACMKGRETVLCKCVTNTAQRQLLAAYTTSGVVQP